MHPREQLYAQKPAGALLYQLMVKDAERRTVSYPSDGTYYGIHSFPHLPAGTYWIFYFDIHRKRLPAEGAQIVVAHYHSTTDLPSASPELSLFDEPSRAPGATSNAAPAAGSIAVDERSVSEEWKRALESARQPAEEKGEEDSDVEEDDDEEEGDGDGDTAEAAESVRRRERAEREAEELREDIAMIRLQQEVNEKNARLLRETVTNKDSVDVYALQGVQRREMVEQGRMTTLGMRREWDRLQKGHDITLENMARIGELGDQLHSVLKRQLATFELLQEKHEQLIKQPPPPQTDWGPIAQTFLTQVGGIISQVLPNGGRALGAASPGKAELPQRSKDEALAATIEAPKPQPGDAAKDVPRPAQKTPAATASEGPAAPPAAADPLEAKFQSLARRFKEMDQAELVQRMTSAEDLVGLLADIHQSLRGDES